MTSHQSANLCPLISREQAGNAVEKALRLLVGRGRRHSLREISIGAGIHHRAIESALCTGADYRPLPLEALLSITLFLGSDFANEWLRVAQLGAYELPDDHDPDLSRVAADSVEEAAAISRIAVDGFQRTDAANLVAVGTRKISRGQQLVAFARRAA